MHVRFYSDERIEQIAIYHLKHIAINGCNYEKRNHLSDIRSMYPYQYYNERSIVILTRAYKHLTFSCDHGSVLNDLTLCIKLSMNRSLEHESVLKEFYKHWTLIYVVFKTVCILGIWISVDVT